MINKTRVLVFVTFIFVFTSFAIAEEPGKPVIKHSMERESFLILVKVALSKACKSPESPFLCFSKSKETCQEYLPKAINTCIEKMQVELPEVIEPNKSRQLSNHISNCIVNKYILIAGVENLEIKKCAGAKEGQ